jgi:CheY-like chemotaxis protein
MAPARRCILVVEDELLVRMMLSDELRDAGYDVLEAYNADEALVILQSVARVDLIVSDVRMPGSMDGLGLLKEVKETFPAIPVIITSAHLHPGFATKDGAAVFFAKPYKLETVIKAVGDELAKAKAIAKDNAPSSILIVDADVVSRNVIADYLRHCGYRVVEAANTDEGFIALGEPTLSIDVILCEVSATGSQDGFQFANWVRTNRPELEVRLAAGVDVAAEKAAKLCESGPHLARPYEPDAVVDYVRRLRASRVA